VATVEEIEEAIQGLSTRELAKFRTWFAEFAAAGRLDALADEALEDLREGRSTER